MAALATITATSCCLLEIQSRLKMLLGFDTAVVSLTIDTDFVHLEIAMVKLDSFEESLVFIVNAMMNYFNF
jgi:hypothetical protein